MEANLGAAGVIVFNIIFGMRHVWRRASSESG
ncbi:hypothetical protein V5J35_002521 [Endozoicomonas sp. NE40]|uniref:Uncharacterized protein n=1 Tax=Endozoicomonas lisbonensis TaxID=3120522 RepID=A0ABV2SHT6_9GAMM